MTRLKWISVKSVASERWGEIIFGLASVMTWIQLLLRPESQRGHYRVFVGAGDYLFQGLNPYGVAFPGTTSGNWLYSVPCGWMYGIFAQLPETLGIALFTALSIAALTMGLRFILSALKAQNLRIPQTVEQGLWLVTASELMGGILSNKLEILMIGLLLIASAWLLSGRRVIAAGIIFGTLLDWKFQPAPIFLLLGLFALFEKREWRFLASGFSTITFWHLLPKFIYSQEMIEEMAAKRGETLLKQLQDFRLFDHLYHFIEKLTGYEFSFAGVTEISLLVGALLGSGFCLWAWLSKKNRKPTPQSLEISKTPDTARATSNSPAQSHWVMGFALVFAIGGFFMNALSPLSQASAYILVAPLWVALLIAISLLPLAKQKIAVLTAVLAWNFISLLFSDLYPKAVRLWAVDWSIKSVGVLFAFILTLFFLSQRESNRVE